jgi:drug/metabolite transporter (DMT)-like permease
MNIFWLVLVTIVWGTTFFIVKDTVANVDEYFIVFIRNLLATIPMVFYTFVKDRKNILNKDAIIKGAIIGFFLFGTYISQTIGLKYTSSGHSAFITGSAVVVVPLILFFFFKEKLTINSGLSILLTFVGLFFLTYDVETDFNIGDIITLITVVAYALHIISAGKFVRKTAVMPLIMYQFLFATIFSLIGFAIIGNHNIVLSTKSFWALLYLGIIGTLFCYFVSVWIQKFVDSIKVALVFSLEPVFAAFFGYLALHEVLSLKEMFGMSLILTGVLLYQYFDNKKKKIK